MDDEVPARGMVVDDDRGSLPFLLVHGEALVTAAAWGLGEAGVDLVDLGTPWAVLAEDAVETGSPVVLHDSLCPLTPPSFIAACVEQARAEDVVVAGVRPVTDTIKRVADGLVGETLDRDRLVAVCSPVVLPASAVGALGGPPSSDFAELVHALRERFVVVPVEAPSTAARVAGPDDVRVLESQERLG